MTTQIPDSFVWQGCADWELLGLQPGILFDPASYGISATRDSFTACYRGFYCWFEVSEERLRLDRLTVFSSNGLEPVTLNGIRPKLCAKPLSFHQYLDLQLPLSYSGNVWLGTGLEAAYGGGRDELIDYRHMHVLRFEKGRLISNEDYSEWLAEVRADEEMDDAEKAELVCELTLPRNERLMYEFL